MKPGTEIHSMKDGQSTISMPKLKTNKSTSLRDFVTSLELAKSMYGWIGLG